MIFLFSLLACSGPGAGRAIARSIEAGYERALMFAGICLLSIGITLLSRRAWLIPAGLCFMLLIHPAWTVSATSGDCGMSKDAASWALIEIGWWALFAQVLWWCVYPWPRPAITSASISP
jgi:hypothetical protein